MTSKDRCVIVGTIEPEKSIAHADLLEALAGPEQALEHNSEFSGRPTTRLFVNDRHVVKLHAAAGADLEQALAEGRRLLQRERRCAVHVPAKTWFVVEDGDRFRLGNITPRLLTLQSAQAQRFEARYLQQLQAMLEMYLLVAGRHRLRLDEGLSNFAAGAGGTVHYLDDDFYPWDDFAHLAQFLGVLLRKTPLLGPGAAKVLGQATRAAALEHCADADAPRRLASAVRPLYFAAGPQQDNCDALLRGLDPPPPRARRQGQEARAPIRLDGAEPIALIADVHSNLPALQAAGEEIRRRGLKRTLVLGDVVGYGPHPGECIRYIREAGYDVVKGNHDEVAATGRAGPGFSSTARQAIDWTRSQLSEEELDWLDALPVQAFGGNWMAQHGAPMDPAHLRAYVYRLTYEDNLDFLAERRIRWALHGHTHVAGVYYRARGNSLHSGAARQSLSGYEQALVCPGSVGQPRGGAAGAELAVFEPDTGTLEFLRLPYDVERTMADMSRAGLAETLIRRLQSAV